MRSIFWRIAFSTILVGCSDQEPFPVGIGSERNELKRSVCFDKEQCKQGAFYRHGRFIQK